MNKFTLAAATLLSLTLPFDLACEGSARKAWESLVGERFSQNPAFAFVENDPRLPNVLIYGDSISIGFTRQVQERLAGQANVYRIHNNGSDSSAFIPKMRQMHSTMRDESLEGFWSFDWDIIQFNVGLHDLKYMADGKLDKKNGKQVTSPAQYDANIRELIAFLREFSPRAKLIFATTTPVPEGSNGRFADDAAVYNQIALRVLADYPDIIVNDLHGLTKPNQSEWWVRPGDVHFNTVGKEAQADEVARIIRNMLPPALPEG
jgi:hypothetical protein